MIFIAAVLLSAVLLLTAAFIRAVTIKKTLPPDALAPPHEDSAKRQDEYAETLSQMIRVASVSDRETHDRTMTDRMRVRLEELFPTVFNNTEVKSFDGALLLRWKGADSTAEPLLLMAHHDVVAATGEWRFPPFDGTVSNGKLYGRGAVDTKCSLFAIMQAVSELMKDGFTPSADVYIASSNNEEITGDGAVKTADYLEASGIRLGLVIDEGGFVVSDLVAPDTPTAMVGIFEKGRANVRFTAHSKGGHASIPMKDNPIARLAAFVNETEKRPPYKARITKPVKLMYEAMAPYMSFGYRLILGNLWLFKPVLPHILAKMKGQAGALVTTTCVFTQSKGSSGANVIPETASVTANMRFMLHQPMDKSLSLIAARASKHGIETEKISGYDIPPVADMSSEAYGTVCKSVTKVFGDIPVIPYVMLAGTDSRHYCRICSCVLRFAPFVVTSAQTKTAHGVDENIDVNTLPYAVEFFKEIVKSYGAGKDKT